MKPIALSIAGSDPSGGAGIQADLRTFDAHGCHGATVLTAITLQNTLGVQAVHALEASWVERQLDVVLDDLTAAAIKTGMLAGEPIVEAVCRRLERRGRAPWVCDPVLAASSGARLLDDAGWRALRAKGLPLVDLWTPNADEAAQWTGLTIEDAADAERAARRIVEQGAAAVLVKGGHLRRDRGTDVLASRRLGVRRFTVEPLQVQHAHGSGCVYSAAITARLAEGHGLERAIELGKRFVTEALRHGRALGRGVGPVDPRWATSVPPVPDASVPRGRP